MRPGFVVLWKLLTFLLLCANGRASSKWLGLVGIWKIGRSNKMPRLSELISVAKNYVVIVLYSQWDSGRLIQSIDI
jgi:hypothetical protein